MARILIVADDLMWSTRLLSQASAAGAAGRTVTGETGLRDALAERPDVVLVDLSGRSFDALDAVRSAAPSGVVIAIGPHEDHALRKDAIAAGARRVYAYRKMHADGVAILEEWLAVAVGADSSAAVAASGA